jgi:signal transduction histidine kinase
LSNAIRFSQLSERKTIDITVDVSRSSPDSEETCLRPEGNDKDMVPFAEGEASPVYIYVSVHDSGPGLKPEDLEILVRSDNTQKAQERLTKK